MPHHKHGAHIMRMIIASLAVALLVSPAWASQGGTGTGKGSPAAGTMSTVQQPVNPCQQGETYDTVKNLCTRANGETYTPVPR